MVFFSISLTIQVLEKYISTPKVGNTEIECVQGFKLNLIQAPSSHHLDKSLLFREMTSLPILDDSLHKP